MASYPAKQYGPGFRPNSDAVFAEPPRISKRKTLPTTPSKPAKRLSPARPSPRVRTSRPIDTLQLRCDRLGTLVRGLVDAFRHSPSWETFVNDHRGPSYLAPELDHVDHPAAELLRKWRDEGVPAESTSLPWTSDQKDRCIHRGCHESANEHSEFLRDEMAEFIDAKSWLVLPYEIVKDLEQIMFSPAAVKEERDRKPRLLCDHSWPWPGLLSVNDSTIAHAPPEAMQFGRTLPRFLYDVRHANPKFGPPRANKNDVKDGFYRMLLKARDCLRLALVLPKYKDEMQLVGIPLACTMGWVQSPPTFCVMSETVCDLANQAIRSGQRPSETHRLEAQAACMDDLERDSLPQPREADDAEAYDILKTLPGVEDLPTEPEHRAPPSNCAFNRPLGSTDVFVDDFIQLGQGGRKRMVALRGHLLEAVDQVLSKPLPGDQRLEAISLKKLLKGDGSWGTRKIILGWIIDTIRQTIELPSHRKLTLAKIFQELAATRRVSHRRWQQILGQLRFVSVAIPGSAGLFGALQLALTLSKGNRVRINSSLRSHIDAFASLVASLAHRPTHLAEIVPQAPTLLGATDAAKSGMGGVYYDSDGQGYLWRHPFPEDVQASLVSKANPFGRVTNSDLEHAGLLAQVAVMGTTHDLRYATVTNGSDNTPAVSRVQKGAVTSDGPAAHLCNYACSHQRLHRYCHTTFFIPGTRNVMADDASRLQHLTDSAFLAHFQQRYPQTKPWRLLHLPSETTSRLISALRSKSPALPTLPRPSAPRAPSSDTGLSSAPCMARPLASVPFAIKKTSSPSSLFTSCDTADSASVTNLYELAQCARQLRPLARGYPTWDTKIQRDRLDPNTSIPYSLISSKASSAKMTPPPGPTRSTSPSSADSSKPLTRTIPSGASSTATHSSCVSLPSTGSCAPPSIQARPTLRPAAKPSDSVTSSSRLTAVSTTPPTHLCMTRTTWNESRSLPSNSLTKRMLSAAKK